MYIFVLLVCEIILAFTKFPCGVVFGLLDSRFMMEEVGFGVLYYTYYMMFGLM